MNRTGFKVNFIDQLPVGFPKLSEDQRNDLVIRDSKKTGEIKYLHYSLFLSESRRFPYFTATNINGGLFKKIPRKKVFDSGRDEWSVDDRIAEHQWGQRLYNAKKSDFQRGHMTKREDPQWGDTMEEAREAAQQTFFFPNCVPQLGDLNTKDWGKLETYILANQSVPNELKVCVFTGPVLTDSDPVFVTAVDDEEIQLPTLFWKVVYYTNDGENLSRVAFLMGQENLLLERGIAVRRVGVFEIMEVAPELFQDFEDRDIYQVNVATIERLTKMRFAPAKEPFKDKRPLKLIIDKVQVANVGELDPVSSMNLDEDTDEVVTFGNMVLTPSDDINLMASGSEVELEALDATPLSFGQKAGPQQQYTSDLKKKFGYYATWNPGLTLKLGDIGIIKSNVFRKIGELQKLGIEFSVELDTTPTDLKYSSKGSVSLTTKLSGAATMPGSSLGQLDAGILVEFTKENAILFQANNTLTHLINDTIHLGEAVLELFKAGKWDKNWVVITELVVAPSATILISNASGAKIELKANAQVNAPALDIANAKLQLSTQFSRAMETEIISKEGLTPLFNVMGIKTSLFSSPDFKAMGITGIDLLTPEKASDQNNKGKVFFGYISDGEQE
jgi:endonuclease G